MEDLLGTKNINSHSERGILRVKTLRMTKSEEFHNVTPIKIKNNRLLVAKCPVRRAPLSLRERARVRGRLLALSNNEIAELLLCNDRGKCVVTPPEFLSSQSSLRNSTLPVQGGRKFAKAGFTLAEVLITLGIIGVVAAMTIPNLMTKLEAIKLQSQYKEAYSTLAQAVKMYNADEERGDGSLYRSLMKYFTGVTDCGGTGDVVDDSPECFIRQSNVDGNAGTVTNRDAAYKTYSKKVSPIRTNLLDDGQFYLQKSGMLVAFDSNFDNPYISVDINGKHSKPNAWGHDLFTFELVASEKEGGYELLPMGAFGTAYYGSREAYCSKTDSSNNINGITCAYYAQSDSSYFKNLP